MENLNKWEVEEKIAQARIIIWSVIGGIFIITFIILYMALIPRYRVWSQEMEGKAEFAKAEQNRRIKVEEAKANLESEKLNALSEIEQAKGAAEANRIIGEGLKGNDEYLRYLWIKGLNDGKNEVIYIPTEGNLPILEARNK
jgi:hypothetical protein